MQTIGQDILKSGPAAAILRGITTVLPPADQISTSVEAGGAGAGFVDVLDEMTADQPQTEMVQADKDVAVPTYVVPPTALPHELPLTELAVGEGSTAALHAPQNNPIPVGQGEDFPPAVLVAQEAGQAVPLFTPALQVTPSLRSGEVTFQPLPAFHAPPSQPLAAGGEGTQPTAPRMTSGSSAEPLVEPSAKQSILKVPAQWAEGVPGPAVATPADPSGGLRPLGAVDLAVPTPEIAALSKTNPAPQDTALPTSEGPQVAVFSAQPTTGSDGRLSVDAPTLRPPASMMPTENTTLLAAATPANSPQGAFAGEAWKPLPLRAVFEHAPSVETGADIGSHATDPDPGQIVPTAKVTQHQVPEKPSDYPAAVHKAQSSPDTERWSSGGAKPAPPVPQGVASPQGAAQVLISQTGDMAPLLSGARVFSRTRAVAPEAEKPQGGSGNPAADLPGQGQQGRLQILSNAVPHSWQLQSSPLSLLDPGTGQMTDPITTASIALTKATAPMPSAAAPTTAAGPGASFVATIPAAWQMISGGMTAVEPGRSDPKSDTPPASQDQPAAAAVPAPPIRDQLPLSPASPEQIASDRAGQDPTGSNQTAPDLMVTAPAADALAFPAGASDRTPPGLLTELSQMERLATDPSPRGPHPHPIRQLAEAVLAAPTDQPGRLELTLTPESLGKLRFDMRMEGDNLAVTLSAENPQTLDLMRRHLPDLMAELKQLGLQAGTMSFGTWGEGRQPSSQTSPQTTAFPPDPKTEPASLAELSAAAPRKGAATGQLDIRL